MADCKSMSGRIVGDGAEQGAAGSSPWSTGAYWRLYSQTDKDSGDVELKTFRYDTIHINVARYPMVLGIVCPTMDWTESRH